MTLERGTLLNNRYRIIEILGQGGMGSIYRAIDEHLDAEVAVKDNLFTSDEYSRQFRREASILAGLRHPNLPRVTDHFVIDGQGQYLVMDYVDGEDLRQRMDRLGEIPEEEVVIIGAVVCDALSYLNSRQPPVVHRDIKPGNVRITPQGQIFLVDFGLAKTFLATQLTSTGARAMTPGYSPPEQYGTARTDHRSDIFSLGSTLYAALTCSIPEDALERALGHKELIPIRKENPQVSRRLASVVEKAMEVRPEDRYQTALEFKQALLDSLSATKRLRRELIVTPPPFISARLISNQIDGSPPSQNGENIEPENEQSGLFPVSTPVRNITRPKPVIQKSPGMKNKPVVALILVLLIGAVFVTWMLASGTTYHFASMPKSLAFLLASTPTAQQTPTSGAIRIEPASLSLVATSTVEKLNHIPTSTLFVKKSITPEYPLSPTAMRTKLPTRTPLPTPLGGGGGEIAFASDRDGSIQIYIIRADGRAIRKVTDIEGGACQPAWSPDGEQLVFISPCNGNKNSYPGSALFISKVDGTGLMPLPTVPGGDFDPAWSPDGKKIIFTSIRDNGYPQLYIYDLLEKSVQQVTGRFSRDMQPSWSKDGKRLIFISERRGYAQVWTMDANGENQQAFSRGEGYVNSRPSWSQDQTLVLFTQSVGQEGFPKLVFAPYQSPQYSEYRITQDPMPMQEGVYSPDGYWIAFEGWQEGGHHAIYLIAVNGAGKIQLTANPGSDFDPAWKPLP